MSGLLKGLLGLTTLFLRGSSSSSSSATARFFVAFFLGLGSAFGLVLPLEDGADLAAVGLGGAGLEVVEEVLVGAVV